MISLPASDYPKILSRLEAVPFNTSFAEAVLRGSTPGAVYVDEATSPAVCLVVVRCGMSLLFGDSEDAAVQKEICDYVANAGGARTGMEILQVHPPVWEQRIREAMRDRLVSGRELELAGIGPAQVLAARDGRLVEWERLNYAFRPDRFRARVSRPLPPDCRVARVGAEGFAFEGTTVPRGFWDDAETFARRGVGYAVLRGNEIASLAFSAFVVPGRIEIGIETRASDRGLGLATHACAALIEHCLAERLEPLWSCRKGNAGSEATARALGFEEAQQLAYFALPRA